MLPEFMKEKIDYTKVNDDEDRIQDLHPKRHGIVQLSRRLLLALIISNIAFACGLLFVILYILLPPIALNTDVKQTSFYSPILNRFEIESEIVTHDNTLWHETIYRQAPSPEVDKAWFDLATPHLYLASTEDIVQIGKDPAYTVRHPTNPDKHVTMLAVDHQLHCLNELRQYIFHEYYNHTHPSPLQIDHTQHCIDLLRQTLACNANLDLITYNWQDIGPDPVPDFKVNMKCRNFDTLREFQKKPLEESGFFSPVDEEGWPWHPKGGKNTSKAPRRWWEYLLEMGYVNQREFERGRLDEGHSVLDR